MAKLGRPIGLTPDRERIILKAAVAGRPLYDCAHAAGIGERTLQTWLRRGESGDTAFVRFSDAVHTARTEASSVATRFWANVLVPLSAAGCWVWQGYQRSEGYGRLVVEGRQVGAHRVSYELHRGPIPDGMEIDHLCRTPECVNPLHLEAVTKRENARRGISPIAKQMDRTHCKRGHDQRVSENVYLRPSGGAMCRICRDIRNAKRYPRIRTLLDPQSSA